jgi:hypothetical protein
MNRRMMPILCALSIACAGRQATRASESLFASPAAELAQELAPDLYAQAQAASALADEAERRKDDGAADDYRTESRLWLAAAIAEAERVQLDRGRAEIEHEEERWAKQLARDQEASATVAGDISRYQAQQIALREAERVSALREGAPANPETIEAIVTRVRLNLALAEALGARDGDLSPLRDRAEALARRGAGSARAAEALLRQSEALVGKMRASWPKPPPGASIDLVETASSYGFSADRSAMGVVVRSRRFFGPEGKLSSATLKRFAYLLAGFPHGPVACQVAVPNEQSRAWEARVARLAQAFARGDASGRVSTSVVVTHSLEAGTVQCTFAAYQAP